MKTLNFTGLDAGKSKQVVDALQQLLADFQVYYTNLRGLHWNVKGKFFFQLHNYFEELYNDAATKIDEVAERILMLDGVPAHNFSDYLKTSKVKESACITDGEAGLTLVLDTFKQLIAAERHLLNIAGECNDEATVAMMSDYIREQEKTVWMLVAHNS